MTADGNVDAHVDGGASLLPYAVRNGAANVIRACLNPNPNGAAFRRDCVDLNAPRLLQRDRRRARCRPSLRRSSTNRCQRVLYPPTVCVDVDSVAIQKKPLFFVVALRLFDNATEIAHQIADVVPSSHAVNQNRFKVCENSRPHSLTLCTAAASCAQRLGRSISSRSTRCVLGLLRMGHFLTPIRQICRSMHRQCNCLARAKTVHRGCQQPV